MAEQANNKDLRCPVCDSMEMRKLHPSEELELTLDYCDQCGGMWFESGEVRQLRLLSPDVLGGLITVKKQLFTVKCDGCGHPMTRNSAECKKCGHENTLDCPVCDTELERVQSDRFTVDACRDCRGVWFDNIDLSQVWNVQFEENGSRGNESEPLGGEGEDSVDTVIAVKRQSRDAGSREQDGSGAASTDGSRNVFGRIADIIGGVFGPEA